MRDKTKTLLHQWFNQVWNENQEDAIDKLIALNAHAHGIAGPEILTGPEGFKTFYKSFKDQFENIQIDIRDVIAEDNMEAAHTDVTATHRETGKQVKFSGLCLARIEDGKIAEAWNHYDFMNMYQQLGHVLTPLTEA